MYDNFNATLNYICYVMFCVGFDPLRERLAHRIPKALGDEAALSEKVCLYLYLAQTCRVVVLHFPSTISPKPKAFAQGSCRSQCF